MLESAMMYQKLGLCRADAEAIQHLRQAVSSGRHWYFALLEAIGLWTSGEEIYGDQYYCYLVGGEAFDWLLLAERLCLEIDGLLPEEEKVNLLFFASPPVEVSASEFRALIGEAKYRAYLNYLYGVVVEEALIAVVEEEVQKERSRFANGQSEYVQQEAYRRVYGADMGSLLGRFRSERGHPSGDLITLLEQKEFTYWLFKYRLENSDKERVASDTKRALDWLQRQWRARMKPRAATLSRNMARLPVG